MIKVLKSLEEKETDAGWECIAWVLNKRMSNTGVKSKKRYSRYIVKPGSYCTEIQIFCIYVIKEIHLVLIQNEF